MADFKLVKGDKVFTHLTHFSNKNGSLKGTVCAEIISVNPDLMKVRVKTVKTGMEFAVPFNAIVRKANTGKSFKKSLSELAIHFNGS